MDHPQYTDQLQHNSISPLCPCEIPDQNGRTGGRNCSSFSEQSQSISQENKAVSEMDRVVQQNAATAEQTSSAAQQMNEQAEQMKDFIASLAALVGGKRNHTEGTSTRPNPQVISRDKRLAPETSFHSGKNLVYSGKNSRNMNRSPGSPDEPVRNSVPERIIPFDDEKLNDF